MAHKKAAGSTRNGRDSESKRLGVKKFGGEVVIPGNIHHSSAWYQVPSRETMLVVVRTTLYTRKPKARSNFVLKAATTALL